MDEEKYFKIPKVWLYIIFGVVTVGILIAVSVLGYYIVNNLQNANKIINQVNTDNQETTNITTTEITEEPLTEGEDSFGKYILNEDGQKDYSQIINGENIVVDWYKGAKKASDDEIEKFIFSKKPELKELYKDEATCLEEPDYRCSIYLYKSGIIKLPEVLAGKELLSVLKYECGMGCGFSNTYSIYDEKTNSLINLVDKEINDYYDPDEKLFPGFITNLGMLKEVNNIPQTFSLPETNSIIFYEGALHKDMDSYFEELATYDNIGGILDVAKGIMAPTSYPQNLAFTDKNYGPIYFVDNNFRYIMPDGSVKLYDLLPYFFAISNDQINSTKNMYKPFSSVNITWYDKHTNNEYYELGGSFGVRCGPFIQPFTNIVNNNTWFDKNKLVTIGETEKGEKVYELSDKTVSNYYREIFDMGYSASKLYPVVNGETDQTNYDEWNVKLENMTDEEKYADFLSDTPLFFWQDYMDNWRVYKKAKYRTLAECGKPVIYLYPEEEMNINVQVDPNGGFSKTEPAYPANGWVVKSSIDSEIYNYANNTVYPYLFWEGHAYDFITPDYGFVMSKDEVPTKMTEILGRLGLVEKEINDFMEFWQPKLEVKPYVFVTFLPQREFDKIAPLTVSPTPDTVIRVMMDYKPLDAPVDVNEPAIWTPQRKGFTVVEWGGRLQ